MKYVYLIHFDEPISHAQHYVGATENVENRLRQHEAGDGARILQVLRERNIGWSLAALWTTEQHFQLERMLKNRKNGKRHCPRCSPTQIWLPYADSYPISQVQHLLTIGNSKCTSTPTKASQNPKPKATRP